MATSFRIVIPDKSFIGKTPGFFTFPAIYTRPASGTEISSPPERGMFADGSSASISARTATGSVTRGPITPFSNMPLSGGEEISVPEAGRVYIAGNEEARCFPDEGFVWNYD